MTDFQVVFPSEAIQLTSVRVLPGVTPRTLDIIGKDFRSVDEVTINDVPLPSAGIVVLSQTRLLAPIPKVLLTATLQTVTVTSRRLTLTKKSTLKFRVGTVASKVRGILRLVQLFLKILFTQPGTDIFSQKIGADALKNVGRTFGKGQSSGIVSDFAIATDTTRRQIIAIQGRDPSIPTDEKLLACRVLSSQFNPQQAALVVSVEITSQAGETATANVVI